MCVIIPKKTQRSKKTMNEDIPKEVYDNYAKLGKLVIKYCIENEIDIEKIYGVIK